MCSGGLIALQLGGPDPCIQDHASSLRQKMWKVTEQICNAQFLPQLYVKNFFTNQAEFCTFAKSNLELANICKKSRDILPPLDLITPNQLMQVEYSLFFFSETKVPKENLN